MEKNKLRNTIIIFIIAIIGIIFLVAVFSGGDKANPQCSDGIDNDGDGMVDYDRDPNIGDPNCNSISDNIERDLTPFVVVFVIIGLVVGGYFGYKIYNKNKSSEEEDELINLKHPIGGDKAYYLARSWFLNHYDLDCERINDDNNKSYLIPLTKDFIVEKDRKIEVHRITGERFQYSFIEVFGSSMQGIHKLTYSLSKGEDWLREGHIDFEKNTPLTLFKKRTRDFNHSSLTDEKKRIVSLSYDMRMMGDEQGARELRELMPSSTSVPTAYDEDSDEFSNRMRMEALSRNKPKKKKTKIGQQNVQQPMIQNDYNMEENQDE